MQRETDTRRGCGAVKNQCRQNFNVVNIKKEQCRPIQKYLKTHDFSAKSFFFNHYLKANK